MCGIAGICDSNHSPVSAQLIREMIDVVRYRGPDESGVHTQAGIGLGHARLSIIDLRSGQQPMHNEDESLWITFNGEIFNYVELRKDLVARGHRFATECDTEVILHLYEEEGERCVQRLNGQWAFAIWDAANRKLFLSRDRLGVRPLFYTKIGTKLIFASEVKSILTCPGAKRELDVFGLDQILTFWFTLSPRTIFKDIKELPPGHSLIFKDGQTTIHEYWTVDFEPEANSTRPEHVYCEQLQELLSDAVRIRLRSDVPVGAYLSGGLDSTIATALARQIANNQLRTFSIAFSAPELDESIFQRDAVSFLHTDHKETKCDYQDIADVFPHVIWHTETPILRTAPGPMYLLSKLVRECGFKVVITGEGADEVFGGYDIYKEAKIRSFWAAQSESKYRPYLLRRLYPYQHNLQKQSDAYLRSFFKVREDDIKNPFFSHLPRWELTSRLKAFVSRDMVAALDSYDCIEELSEQLPPPYFRWPSFCQAQYLETRFLLPGYILSSQGDRVGMAHSVEARHPFLDYRIVELGARMPTRLKMKVLNEKYILKKTFQSLLPSSIVNRPKQPYRAPDGKSFFAGVTSDYVNDLLAPKQIAGSGIFDSGCVTALMKKFRTGNAIGVKDDMAMVGILSTQLLVDQFIEHFQRGGSTCVPSKMSYAAS